MNEVLQAKLAATVRRAALVVALVACSGREAQAPPPAQGSLQHRIAHALVEASPPADPADAKARDLAGEKLSHVEELLDAAGERILWGGRDDGTSYDPKAHRLTEFSPLVWAKLYLSAFTFAGPYEVRREGKLTVLEIDARFRDGLDSGDYPYPFWHSAKKWQEYVNTQSLVLVFDDARLVAAYRRAASAPPRPTSRRWDGRWRWTDDQGAERPRVALFTYLLSPDNPSIGRLDRAYRSLETAFRSNNCVTCHSPDNPSKASLLLLLGFPNQALVARHSLVEVLRGNKMPPADPGAGQEAGLGDETARRELLALAEQFEREADAALAFEKAHPAARAHR